MSPRTSLLLSALVLAMGCGDASSSQELDEEALRTDSEEEDNDGSLAIAGAVRAEWRRTTGGNVETLRVAEGAETIERVLAKLTKSEDEPSCSATRSVLNWGGRMGPGRTIPKVGEAIVFLDDDGKSLARVTLYPCESTLVTLKRTSDGSAASYRMQSGFKSAFRDAP
jgi:hypothetical protein